MTNYIRSFTWSKDQYDYFKNKKGERLHRVVMKTTDSFIYINHLGGNKYDNRVQNLTISNCLDNSKEKRVGTRNKSGIVGLMKRGKSDKWVGSVRVEGVVIYSKYKTKEEALIDLLILQKHYGFRHNTHLYNLIDDICPDRENDVINLSKDQIKRAKLKIPNIKSKNIYELSNCKTYYRVYDVNKNYFTIDVHNKKVIEEGIWRVAYPNKLSDKSYVLGDVIINGVRKGVKLHRYLFDLLELKYKNIYVDH